MILFQKENHGPETCLRTDSKTEGTITKPNVTSMTYWYDLDPLGRKKNFDLDLSVHQL